MADGFPLEDLVRLPDFYAPVASPSGDRVAYYGDETGRIELYVRDVETGDTDRLSDGDVPRTARYPIAWGADGDRIYFHRGDGGDEQNDLYEMTLDGERSPVVDREGQCVLEDVGPDGRYLLFTSTAGNQKNLYRYDRETGASERLTAYERPVWTALFSPDGDRVAYVTNEADDLENRDVYVAGVARLAGDPPVTDTDADTDTDGNGDAPRNLDVGEVGSETAVVDWDEDDRLLLGDNAADLGRVGSYDLDADAVTWYGPGEYEERAVRFTPGGGVLATRARDCAEVPVRYADPDGAGEEFDLPDGFASLPGGAFGGVSAGTFTADGRVLVAHETASSRRELYAYDLDADEYGVVLAAEYGDFDPAAFGDAEHVTYDSHDGLEIDGLLYDSGERPSPALVKVHGGPHARSVRRFDPFVQYLLDRGYSVFAPNYRGSTGRGREFKNAVHGDWGGDEQGDVAEAGRWLADRDWIDGNRVAVFGGSYGGYSTYSQLTTYPELWTAGIALVGITDLELLYEESMPHFESILEEQLGDPEENRDLYRERSPLTHVGNVERPLCMVHGVNDPRCPVSQARVFRDALEARGYEEGEDGEFEYHELGEEGHGTTDTEQRIRRYELLVDYVERRL